MSSDGPDRILLIGMMGAGKTTTGAALAGRLGWGYLDSDAEIRRLTGRTVPEIWHAQGETAFRRMETQVLQDAASGPDHVVVTVAGGAVLDPANRQVISNAGLVVWLRADPDTLRARVGDGTGRPLLDGDPAAAISALYEERRPVYEALSDVVVDVDGKQPADVVDAIVAARSARERGRS